MKKSIPKFESYIWQCYICLSNNFIVLLFLLASGKHLILLKQVIGVTHIQGWCLFKNLIEKCCANSRAVLVWGFLAFWKPNQFVEENWKNIYKLLMWVGCCKLCLVSRIPNYHKWSWNREKLAIEKQEAFQFLLHKISWFSMKANHSGFEVSFNSFCCGEEVSCWRKFRNTKTAIEEIKPQNQQSQEKLKRNP